MNPAAFGRRVSASLVVALGCAAPRFELDPNDLGFELPKTPVVIFFVDGLHKPTFEAMAEKGQLPLLRRFLLDRGVEVVHPISDVPSVTFANATTLVTGRFPAHHGIFANRWFDRHQLASRSYESLSTLDDTNLDITVPTLYELLEGKVTAVIGMQINRGAHIRLVTDASNGGLPAGIAWVIGDHAGIDSIMAGNLGEIAAQSRTLRRWPDLTLVYFPAVDAVGHLHGVKSSEYRSTLRDLDDALGGALRTFDRAGLLERMTVVLVSEHGQLDAGKRRFLELDRFLGGELGIPTYLTNTEGERTSDVPYTERVKSFRRFRIIATHDGERHASLHLRSKRDWAGRSAFEEILAFHEHGAPPDEPGPRRPTFPEILARHPAIDFAVVRSSDDETYLWSKVGVARIRRHRRDGGNAYSYDVESGGDPLGYASDPHARALCDGEFHASRDWLHATASLQHPDIVPLLGEAFDSPRAGDVMLFAAPGWDFSRDYVAGHGGIERDEMVAAMYFAGPGLPPGGRVRAARLADLTPTILDLMGWENRKGMPHLFDGVSIADSLRSAVP